MLNKLWNLDKSCRKTFYQDNKYYFEDKILSISKKKKMMSEEIIDGNYDKQSDINIRSQAEWEPGYEGGLINGGGSRSFLSQ